MYPSTENLLKIRDGEPVDADALAYVEADPSARAELRRLRDRLLRREIAKSDYYDRVVEVRCRYPLLSLKVWQWVEASKAHPQASE